MISVDIGPAEPDLAAQWKTLIGHAPGNVFLNPVALIAAQNTKFAKLHVLRAWDRRAGPDRLVGLWALQERNIASVWPAFLAAPPYDYAFSSGPVVERAVMAEVVAAFFDAIEGDPRLPNILSLKFLDGDCAVYPAIHEALAARGSQILTLSESARAFATRQAGVKRSGSTAKKLRQHWNRLSALGAVEVVNDRATPAARAAFEDFLVLEAQSWKGGRGTALLCSDADAAFTRRLVGDLAAQGDASVALLRLGGRAIAAQVLLYCGSTAYTWKTAFDASFGKFSPGALLVDKVTEELFAAGAIETIDSCSPAGSFMDQLWTGRHTMVDLLVDVGAGRSLGFAFEAMRERGYAQLRDLRKRLRGVSWPGHPKKGIAASL